MSGERAAGIRLVLIAPFATGWTLDAQRLLRDGWGEKQRTLATGVETAAAALEGSPRGWTSSADRSRRYTDFSAELADQLHAEVPQTFIECGGKALREHVASAHDDLAGLAGLCDDATFTLREVTVGIADFGVGVMTLEYAVALAPRASPERYRAAATDLGQRAAPLLDALVPDVVAPLDAYLKSDAGRPLCRAGGADLPATRSTMWTHVLHVIGTERNEACAASADEWRSVLPLTHDVGCETAQTDDVVFRPGLGTSLVVHAPGGADRAATLSRVVALQTLYYVGATAIDRLLFERLNSLALDTREGKAQELMRGSAAIRELYEGAELFRSVVANLDLHLAASTAWEVRAWGCLAQVWRLDRRLASIDRRLDALQRLYARVTGELAAERSHALTLVVFAFTAIATASTVLAAIDFTQSGGLDSPDGGRIAILVVLIAAVAALSAAALSWANRPMRRGASSGLASAPRHGGRGERGEGEQPRAEPEPETGPVERRVASDTL